MNTFWLFMTSAILSFICFAGSIYLCVQEVRAQNKKEEDAPQMQSKIDIVFWGSVSVGLLILSLSTQFTGLFA